MTNKKDKSTRDIDIEVPSGTLFVTGHAAEALVEASATAVDSLSTASLSASSVGYDEVATATEALQLTIHQTYYITGPVTINQQQSFTLTQQSAAQIEQQIKDVTETLTAQGVPCFDCKEAFHRCMADAGGTGARHHCRLIYAACLGHKFIPLVG